MRYITLLISASFLFFACGEEGEASIEKVDLAKVETTTGGPEIVFAEEVWDFGQVKTGDSVVHQYVFKNTGDQPLIIAQAKAGCGCTITDKPTDPILPGESGAITAKINKAGHAQSNKEVSITVDSNAKSGKKVLKLMGDIVEK